MRLASQFQPESRTGVCSTCGTEAHTDEGVILTDIFIDQEGTFDICGRCIKQAAEMLGMVSAEKAKEVEDTLDELTVYSAEVYETATDQRRQIEDLARCLANLAEERDELRAERDSLQGSLDMERGL